MLSRNVLLAALVAVSISAKAQDASVPMPYLAIDRNQITAAIGGARATDALFNPAAIPFTGSDIALSYQNWAPSVAKASHVNLLAGIKLGKRVGLSIKAAGQFGAQYDSFTPYDLFFGAGVGFAFTDFLSAGVNLAYTSEKLARDLSFSAFAADAFLLLRFSDLKVSAGVCSVGTPVKSGNRSYPLPSSAKIGASYSLPFGLSFSADGDFFFNGGIGAAVGAQYGWDDMLFVRVGYHYGSDKAPVGPYLSLGAGVKFVGFHLDFCYMTASQALNGTWGLGVGFAF
ncbi:MAG: hypothetical protein J6X99_04770 [Bacteroidales bacterium]|nr:hypothetical protein [Bacteroidales bacterium]